MRKKIFFLLFFIGLIGLFLHFYKLDQSPPCINADEAAFGYNAYSILKTGRDEYGTFLPLRLKSFGDYKMPLLSYLTIPFVALFGLNHFSIKLINAVVVFFFPFFLYIFSQQLFNKKNISLLAAFLSIVSWSIQSMSRQLHEALLTSLLILISSIFFIKTVETKKLRFQLSFLFFLLLSLFSYHFSRVFAVFFFLVALLLTIQKKISLKFLSFFLLVLIFFAITDIVYQPKRLSHLVFFNNLGFSLNINQLRNEGGSRLLYNKATVGFRDIIYQYLKYFSLDFLVIKGDDNYRFGFSGISPVTLIEYSFFIIGLYYLFKNKIRWRFLLLGLLLISPLSACLSWDLGSLTRSFFIIIPILILSSYGVFNFLNHFSKKNRLMISLAILLIFFILNLYNWDFYLNHYPKRGEVIISWQCGYRQLSNYLKNNYGRFDTFYITKEHGMPYIFLLFYLNYPPEKYQQQANLGPEDEYGFGQIEKFDKFDFTFRLPKEEKKYVSIAYPHDFKNLVDERKIKKIKIKNNEIFWIYESPIN